MAYANQHSFIITADFNFPCQTSYLSDPLFRVNFGLSQLLAGGAGKAR